MKGRKEYKKEGNHKDLKILTKIRCPREALDKFSFFEFHKKCWKKNIIDKKHVRKLREAREKRERSLREVSTSF